MIVILIRDVESTISESFGNGNHQELCDSSEEKLQKSSDLSRTCLLHYDILPERKAREFKPKTSDFSRSSPRSSSQFN